jgi:oligosaccharyltransferase complex subunit delta (ribophorin II)
MNKPTPINTVQAVKFSTYFLSRRTVQTAKGVSILLDAITTITNDKVIAPISIHVISKQISPDNQALNVKVCDLLGNALSPALAALSTTITAKQSNQALVSKVNLVPSRTDNTLFTYDLKSVKPARGVYKVDIDVNGVYKQSLPINVLGRVSVKSLEIGVGDSDSTTAVKTTEVNYPKKLDQALKADSQQKILLKALLVDEVSQKPMTVHQAFVRLNHKATNKEIIFVAEQDSSKAYKFDMDFGSRSGDFNFVSGEYVIELIVGDASLSNSFKWHVADIQLKFTQGSQSGELVFGFNKKKL